MGDDLGLRATEVFPALSGHTDTWKPLLKAVRANSLTELSRRVRSLPFSEDVCGMHFPLKVVPDPEHEELPCTEWFAYKPSGVSRSTQTDAFMPLLFAAVHNVYRWGHGYGIQDPTDPAAKQSRQSLEIVDFILRHGGDPASSCFLGLELDVKEVSVVSEPPDSPLPTNETQRARWCTRTTDAFRQYFQTHRLSPLRRNIRVTSGDYGGRMLVEAYGDLAAGDELQWETTLTNQVEVRVSAMIADWHFAPVVACDVETKENYLYIPIGGERAPRDYAIMLKEYAARLRMDRACEALDVVIERFRNWLVVEQRAPEMVLVPASMQQLFQDIYSDHSTSDVTLEAEGRALPAHRIVLSGASPYFRALLTGPFLEGNATRVVMECEFDVLEAMLQFIYTGRQDTLVKKDPLRVLPIAHKYGLDALQHVCEINARNGLAMANLGVCLRLGHLHGSGILRDACLDFIAKNPVKSMCRPEIYTLRIEDPELWIKLIVTLGVDDGTTSVRNFAPPCTGGSRALTCSRDNSNSTSFGNHSSFLKEMERDCSDDFGGDQSRGLILVESGRSRPRQIREDDRGKPGEGLGHVKKEGDDQGVDRGFWNMRYSETSIDTMSTTDLGTSTVTADLDGTRATFDSDTPDAKRGFDEISGSTEDSGLDLFVRPHKQARRSEPDDASRNEPDCAIM